MNRAICKWISCFLAAIMLAGILPLASAMAAEEYTMSDGYITVTVSGGNGGFSIRTQEGDKLIKSDNNKDLLHRFGRYDTSFTSFEVTYPNRGGEVCEYLFGGNYSFLGLGSNNITTQQDASGIESSWTVDGLTFTQRIELANQAAAEHGMAYISYKVLNAKAEPVSVKARVLLDTALGDQDWAVYEVVDQFGVYRTIERERIITQADYIPQNFFAYDDNKAPSITAYTVNSTMPYQIAFAHWNSLASTLFNFTPKTDLTFTNPFNGIYLTADSAVAYYYDMGNVASGAAGNTVSTYYGVYSNRTVSAADSVAVNLTAPTEMELAADKKTYLPSEAGLAPGVFSVQTQVNNFVSDTAKGFAEVTVAAYAANGITPLNENGEPLSEEPTYLTPYTARYFDFGVGATQTRNFYFKADVGAETEYRKVEIRVFDTSGTDKTLTQDKLVGYRYFYILCPGGDGKLPEITFTGASPQILYNEGTRRLYLTGRNFSLLLDGSRYDLRAYNKTNPAVVYDIPFENISFPADVSGENIMDIAITETMAPGSYELVFDWIGENAPAGINKRMTAPALNFTVSNDVRYKNDYYGLVAVVQDKGRVGSDSQYSIKTYKDENEFNADKGNYEEILLVFRGAFDLDKRDSDKNPAKLTATSVKKADGTANNVITVNNCLDFEKGTVIIEKEGDTITVDFDGDLLTSIKRSKIWTGKSTFTEIKNGTEYGLVQYNKRAEVLVPDSLKPADQIAKPITLLWPFGLSIAQTISGMAFNLTFGSMGIMYDTEDKAEADITSATPVKGHCVSFSANLDLSFLIPKAKLPKEDTEWSRLQKQYSLPAYEGKDLRATYYGTAVTTTYTDEEPDKKVGGQASVMVKNIMYGCGEGFMGIKFTAKLGVPPYIDGMPVIRGELSVNTFGGWAVGLNGTCKVATLTLEAGIDLKSYKGAPIPDKMYFIINGFEPGINIDGCGVVWITGGGGGFKDLYDTIFVPSTLPPLKLMLSVSFDILKALQARADMTIGPRGLSITATNIAVKGLNVVVLNRAALVFEWYPEFYFMASVNANILGIITGSGYIVVMESEQYKAFVEFFIRATLKLPAAIPVIGGTAVGNVDLGANNDKIWGALKVLSIGLGITYHWGGDVDFGTGAAASPTFPGLLDYPIGYDEETGQTLYMRLGGNVSIGAMAEIAEDFDAAVRLLGGDAVLSKGDKRTHQLSLGTYTDEARALTITYFANDENEARALAKQITFDPALTLDLYDPARDNAATANANLSFDGETKKASLSVTFTDASVFDKDYDITTPVAADLILYDIAAIPEITALTANAPAGDKIKVDWNGTDLGDLDSLSFYLTSDPQGIPGGDDYPLGSLTDGADILAKTADLDLPGGLQTGTYYVRAVYSQEDVVNGTFVSGNSFSYTNPKQPADPSGVTMQNSGDYTFTVTAGNSGNTDYDGYMLSLYEWDGDESDFVPTDFAGLTFEKADDRDGNLILPELRAGGSYTISDEDGNPITAGLSAGKRYKAGISAYKYVYDTDGETPLYAVYSKEVLSGEETLRTPTPPSVELISKTSFKTLTRIDESGEFDVDTFAVSDVVFELDADMPVSGSWEVDSGEQEGNIGSISLSGLEDGDHTLTLRGTNGEGDSYYISKIFAVDTKPPKLMLTSPRNGSFFSEDGELVVSGITDPGAILKVVVSGVKAAETAAAVDSQSGAFSLTVSVDASAASHYVQISVADEAGNFYEEDAIVVNRGLGSITGLAVYINGAAQPDNNLPSRLGGSSAQLSLAAKTAKGNTFMLDNSMVEWSARAVEGSASVDANGVLSVGAGSMGTVSGRFYVSPTLEDGSGLDGAMIASATFGAENNGITNDGRRQALVTAETGGTVTGSDMYAPGETVTVTAAPNTGYSFAGWVVTKGTVTLSSTTNPIATFTMPAADVTINAKFNKENAPNARIDYLNETLTDFESGGVYTFNNGAAVTVTGTIYPIDAGWLGSSVVIVKKGDGGGVADSEPQSLSIPARPGTPTPGVTHCTTMDNNDGSITGVTAAMEYQKSGGAGWTNCPGTAITGLAPGSYNVRIRAAASNFKSETATVTVGAYTAVKETTPAAVIDYANETLTGLVSGGVYTFNGGAAVTVAGTTYAIDAGWLETSVSVVKKGDGITTVDSDTQSVNIPARPDIPTPEAVSCTTPDDNNGSITGVTTAMEYSVDGTVWTDCTGTAITGLVPGVYYVRVKATGSAFKSLSAAVTVGSYNAVKETTPAAGIDYLYETLTGLVDGIYTFNGGEAVTVMGTTCAIDAGWLGTPVSIVKKGDGVTTVDSDAQNLNIPARPNTPAPGKTDCTTTQNNDGSITGVTTAMEYSANGTIWTDCADATVTGLTPGTYYVRVKAATGSFRSEITTVVIGPCTSADEKWAVSLTAESGGTVTGAAEYAAGDTVTITAVPAGGYNFTGWTVTKGTVTLSSSAASTVTFIMPSEDVAITAHFSRQSSGSSGGGATSTPKPTPTPAPVIPVINETSTKAGELVSMNLPQGVDENVCVVYCFIGGEKTYVKLSAVIDGKMYFIAPYDAEYYVEENKVKFSDTSGHWAERYIDFSAARELFVGVSSAEFDPEGSVTRAMFVTVLGRLSNIDEKEYATVPFKDVKAGLWYAPYVTWAAENGIVFGYDSATFGPDDFVTREQMCAIFKRYLDFAGYFLSASGNEAAVFLDRADISDWALESVIYCQNAGLVQGKENNRFDPQGNLTRAEASTVFEHIVKGLLNSIMTQ